MLLGRYQKFKLDIETRYPYLTVDLWDDGRFLEDYKRAYVALVPINQTEYGTARVSQRNDLFDLFTRFWVVWKLPKVNDDIISAAIQESEILGPVKSVTWNTTLIYQRLGYQYPPKKIPFVAVEVELEVQVLKSKNVCECLLKCSDDIEFADLDFDLRWFPSDEAALAAGYPSGKNYLLTHDNIYGMPKGTQKRFENGEVCLKPGDMPWFENDTEALMEGYQGYYLLKEANLYGMPKGVVKLVAEPTFINPGTLGWADDDLSAGANGVPLGAFYKLLETNLLGMPKGTLKKRVE
jgi:hypothetical protein